MKRTILPALTTLLITTLLACGSGGGGGEPAALVDLQGNIYNEGGASIFAALVNTMDPLRLADVSASEPIRVTTSVSNEGGVAMKDLTINIEVADPDLAEAEHWMCSKKVARLDGQGWNGISIWIEYFEPLPACEGEPSSWDCDPLIFECGNPYWEVDYSPPREGIWKTALIGFSLQPGESRTDTVGYRGGSNPTPSNDRLARWTLKDAKGAELKVREYIFNVVP